MIPDEFNYREPPFAALGVFAALFTALLILILPIAFLLWVIVRIVEALCS